MYLRGNDDFDIEVFQASGLFWGGDDRQQGEGNEVRMCAASGDNGSLVRIGRVRTGSSLEELEVVDGTLH